MSHEHSLTFAAHTHINNYVEKQAAKAAEELNRRQTAEELWDFLTDGTMLCTPGFVLRRYIQSKGVVSKEACADLSQTGNVPWPEDVVYQAAKDMSAISYQRHVEISTANWEKYLTDRMPQGIQREMIFKLAIVTGMGREETMDLLLSADQAPYNMRNPLELICWFCQYIPGIYTWRGVQRLLYTYYRFISENGTCGTGGDEVSDEESADEAPDEGTTRLIQWSVEELLDSGIPAGEAEEQKLMELMAEHCVQLDGFSRTAQSGYLRLTAYLNALYLPGGRTNLHRLISAMYKAHSWNFDNLFQSPSGERYVFRGGVEDEFAPRVENCVLNKSLGDIAKFCKRYYPRANAIEKGVKGVDRRDVLLLGHFLITGYISAEENARTTFWKMAEGDAPMDQRMALLREDLDALARKPGIKEKQELCCRVFNDLLAEFDFRSLYVPAPFDRLILLSLLTDRPAWTIRYLLGEELES